MNTLLDFFTVAGFVWTLCALGLVVTILWFGCRDEPPLEDEPEAEVFEVDFRNGNHGRAA